MAADTAPLAVIDIAGAQAISTSARPARLHRLRPVPGADRARCWSRSAPACGRAGRGGAAGLQSVAGLPGQSDGVGAGALFTGAFGFSVQCRRWLAGAAARRCWADRYDRPRTAGALVLLESALLGGAGALICGAGRRSARWRCRCWVAIWAAACWAAVCRALQWSRPRGSGSMAAWVCWRRWPAAGSRRRWPPGWPRPEPQGPGRRRSAGAGLAGPRWLLGAGRWRFAPPPPGRGLPLGAYAAVARVAAGRHRHRAAAGGHAGPPARSPADPVAGGARARPRPA